MKMTIKDKTVSEIFDDLDAYREFCAYAYLLGFRDSFPYDEADLYNMRSYAWRAYQNYLKYGKPPKDKPRNFDKNRGNKPRFERRK
jgi:hypothetical protein